jgi:hypothetical protein
MVKRSVTAIVLFICLTTVARTSVNAQSSQRFDVDVPFSFALKGQTLPAGKYAVERTDWTRPNVLTLKNVEKGIVRLLLTERVEKENPSPVSSLVFIKREGRHYLFQIWNGADMNGRQIPLALDENTHDQQRNNVTLVTLKARH